MYYKGSETRASLIKTNGLTDTAVLPTIKFAEKPCAPHTPQWGAAHAEIKVSSDENA